MVETVSKKNFAQQKLHAFSGLECIYELICLPKRQLCCVTSTGNSQEMAESICVCFSATQMSTQSTSRSCFSPYMPNLVVVIKEERTSRFQSFLIKHKVSQRKKLALNHQISDSYLCERQTNYPATTASSCHFCSPERQCEQRQGFTNPLRKAELGAGWENRLLRAMNSATRGRAQAERRDVYVTLCTNVLPLCCEVLCFICPMGMCEENFLLQYRFFMRNN